MNDKEKHIIVSFIMTLVFGYLTFLAIPFTGLVIGDTAKACAIVGAVLSLFIGAAKEVIYDWLMKKGDPDFVDFLADVGGVSAGVALILMLF